MLHLEKKCHMCKCVCYYEGTLKQFNDMSTRMQRVNSAHRKSSPKTLPRSQTDAPTAHEAPRVRFDTASLDFFLAPYFSIPEGRAPPADFTAAVAAALFVPLAWTKQAQLHRNSLRVQAFQWHTALRFQDAELQ